MNAFKDLEEELDEDEVIEAVVFGDWGWDGYEEPRKRTNPPVPKDKRGVILSIEEAKPMMEGWGFNTGYGAPTTYATYIWTDKSIYFIMQYDGATSVTSIPRNPESCMPEMPGRS